MAGWPPGSKRNHLSVTTRRGVHSILRNDVEQLRHPGNWLTSGSIDALLLLLRDHARSDTIVAMTDLSSNILNSPYGAVEDLEKLTLLDGYANAQAASYIVLPLNLSSTHWGGWWVDWKGSRLIYCDSLAVTPKGELPNAASRFLPQLIIYLQKHAELFGNRRAQARQWEVLFLRTKQPDGNCCGVMAFLFCWAVAVHGTLPEGSELVFNRDTSEMAMLRLRLVKALRDGQLPEWPQRQRGDSLALPAVAPSNLEKVRSPDATQLSKAKADAEAAFSRVSDSSDAPHAKRTFVRQTLQPLIGKGRAGITDSVLLAAVASNSSPSLIRADDRLGVSAVRKLLYSGLHWDRQKWVDDFGFSQQRWWYTEI